MREGKGAGRKGKERKERGKDIKSKKKTPRHIILKLLKIKAKDKIQKAASGRKTLYTEGKREELEQTSC